MDIPWHIAKTDGEICEFSQHDDQRNEKFLTVSTIRGGTARRRGIFDFAASSPGRKSRRFISLPLAEEIVDLEVVPSCKVSMGTFMVSNSSSFDKREIPRQGSTISDPPFPHHGQYEAIRD